MLLRDAGTSLGLETGHSGSFKLGTGLPLETQSLSLPHKSLSFTLSMWDASVETFCIFVILLFRCEIKECKLHEWPVGLQRVWSQWEQTANVVFSFPQTLETQS